MRYVNNCWTIAKLTKCITLLFCLLLLSSCSNKNLSRNKAEEMLKEHFKSFSITEKFRIKGMMAFRAGERTANEVLPEFQTKGLLTYTIGYQHPWNDILSLFTATFTNEGSKYVVGKEFPDGSPHPDWDPEWQQELAINLKCCEAIVDRITGIVPIEGTMKGARVEYEWHYSNPTPFSQLSRVCTKDIDRSQTGSFIFTRYDDGWRIEKNR